MTTLASTNTSVESKNYFLKKLIASFYCFRRVVETLKFGRSQKNYRDRRPQLVFHPQLSRFLKNLLEYS